MDYSLLYHRSIVRLLASDLATLALVVSLPVLKANISRLRKDIQAVSVAFRLHVRMLKSLEATWMMLAKGRYRGVIASALAEIRSLLPLVQEGTLNKCVYGLPIRQSALPPLVELRRNIKIILMVDNVEHIDLLESFGSAQPWDVFIKVDVGSHRAGLENHDEELTDLVRRAEASSAVLVYGFYCHAGHSYACRTQEEAEEAEAMLQIEVQEVIQAASLVDPGRRLVLSVGATPAAHIVLSISGVAPPNMTLELHAGNFPCNDLQQASTGLAKQTQQAVRVCAEVCSVYRCRNEALVNAGAIALSREPSAFPGFGVVGNRPGWNLEQLSREHGIIGWVGEKPNVGREEPPKVGKEFTVGQKISLYCNHSCITSAAFYVYYIVDENDTVQDTWIPWKVR